MTPFRDEDGFAAAVAAARSATCRRARCGAVVVKDGQVIGSGFNAPPGDDETQRRCDATYATPSPKPKSDRTCCVHAEWRAITDALRRTGDLTGADLYFTRVNEAGERLPSGGPYCTVCSRLALDCGIARFGLWHETGITMYDTRDYNARSYATHNPTPPNPPLQG